MDFSLDTLHCVFHIVTNYLIRRAEKLCCVRREVCFESLQHHFSILAAALRDITRMCGAEGTVLFVLDVV